MTSNIHSHGRRKNSSKGKGSWEEQSPSVLPPSSSLVGGRLWLWLIYLANPQLVRESEHQLTPPIIYSAGALKPPLSSNWHWTKSSDWYFCFTIFIAWEPSSRAEEGTNCFTFRFQLQWLLLLPSLELHWDGKLKLMEPKRLARGNERSLPGMPKVAGYMYLFEYSYVLRCVYVYLLGTILLRQQRTFMKPIE